MQKPVTTRALSLALFALCGGLATAPAQAALINIDAVVEIDTVDDVGEFLVGDQFTLSLTYDDSQVDSEPSPAGGNFPFAITALTLAASASNTGTWDPSAGVFNLPGRGQSGQSNAFRFQPTGAGFPSFAGNPFLGLDLLFVAPNLVDQSGTTIAEQLGGPLSSDLSDYSTARLGFVFDLSYASARASGSVIDLSVQAAPADVPEPSSVLLLGSGLLLGAGWVRRQKRSKRE